MLRWFQSHSILIDLAVASTLALTLLVALHVTGLPQTSQTTFDSQFELHSGRTVGQSFVGEAPGLYRVDVLVGRRGPTTYPLLFHLQEEEAPSDHVVTVELDASLLQDTSSLIRRPNSYQSFNFDPVQDSRGKRLYFYLESPRSTPDHPLVLSFQSHDAYSEGTRYVDGVEDGGDLAFKAYYRDTQLATARVLLGRLTEGKPTPLSLEVCYPITAFAYLLTFARLARLLLAFWFNLSRQQ
ncbi:MAG TPA: hypothetical protein VMW58_04765 [Anaerolineae bacterium]|nr:hypothetical protein [Anaerolineae bacterium]